MKKQYFYVVALGMDGFSAVQITIVKASSKKDLAAKGFREKKDQEVNRFSCIEEAESFCKQYASDYPKHRIKYWV